MFAYKFAYKSELEQWERELIIMLELFSLQNPLTQLNTEQLKPTQTNLLQLNKTDAQEIV